MLCDDVSFSNLTFSDLWGDYKTIEPILSEADRHKLVTGMLLVPALEKIGYFAQARGVEDYIRCTIRELAASRPS